MRSLFYVNYYDSFENHHPRVFVPLERPYRPFESVEEICNYLLGHKEVVAFFDQQGPGGKAAFVMFDEETERLAAEVGLEIIHPPAALRKRLDSKIVTTQIGNDAGVPSVPNVLGRAGSYERAARAGRGARPRRRPRGADAVRRLRPDDLLRPRRRRLRGGPRRADVRRS